MDEVGRGAVSTAARVRWPGDDREERILLTRPKLAPERSALSNANVRTVAPAVGEAGAGGLGRGLRRAFRALRHRNYRLYFSGQLVSLIGTWMQSVAQSWLVYRLTGSATLLGVVGFASQVPTFLLAPAGGVLADRWPRRRILVATQSVSALLALGLAALTLSGRITVPALLVFAGLLGVVNAIDIPARQAFVVEMVGREDLINAIALNSTAFNGARVVGPAAAGLLVAAIGEGWCFLVNSASFLAVIGSLLRMRLAPAPTRPPHAPWLESLVEGFRYVAAARPVRALLLLLGLVSFTGMPYVVLMPIFADRILGGGPSGLGILMGATGIGALGGAMALAARERVSGLGRRVALAAGGFGLALIGFSAARAFWLSAALLVPVGFFLMSQMAASNTLIQAMVPDAFRGRVMALYAMMFMGMAPFGALVSGAAADRFGAPLVVAAGGALCGLGAIVFARRLPQLRAAAHELMPRPPEATAGGPGELS